MSLRRKFLVLFISTLAGLVVVLAICSGLIMESSFSALEEEDMRQNVSRAQEALWKSVNEIEQSAADYSYWDSMYAYAAGEDPEFVETELGSSVLIRLGISQAFAINQDGEVLFRKAVDLQSGQDTDFPEGLDSLLAPGSAFLKRIEADGGASGILVLPGGPLLISAQPILTSEGKGPGRGFLFMAAWLDKGMVEHLEGITRLELQIEQVNNPDLAGDFSRANQELKQPEDIRVRPLNQETVAGYIRIDDLLGKPGLLLRVVLPRSIYLQGRANLIYLILTLLIAGVVFGVVVTMMISRQVIQRVTRLSGIAERISLGEVEIDMPATSSADEIGGLERSFARISQYISEAAGAARSLASGDLRVGFSPRAEVDELGHALVRMIANLREILQNLSRKGDQVRGATRDLHQIAAQTGEATHQVALTLQQISTGINQQSESTSQTACAVDQMTKGIQEIVQGANRQNQAVENVSKWTVEINTGIQLVSQSARDLEASSSAATQAAQNGSQTVSETIQGMERIRAQMGITAARIQEMGRQSDQIGTIVETIGQIAGQTNLLALNAAIEAARASGKTSQITQQLLQNQLVAVAALLAEIDLRSEGRLDNADMAEIAGRARVDTVLISDTDGVIMLCNETGLLGYRFSEDPREQSSAFRPLLQRNDGMVTQPIQPRSKDGMPYMWVGVSRHRQPGIIQAGMTANAVERNATFALGFAVVADEVRKLADQAGKAAKEIDALIRAIQGAASEAVSAMQDSSREIENGVGAAHQAGEVLGSLLQTAQGVYRQAEQVSNAAGRMQGSAQSLVGAVQIVSTVVDENVRATHQMDASAAEVSHAMENIASISQQNSAAVEEVTAATGEMAHQSNEVAAAVKELTAMAEGLQAIIHQFHL